MGAPAEADHAVYHFVDRHLVEGRGDRIAFIDANGPHTYREFAATVNRAGNVLRDLGVIPGERVMLALNDGLELPALFFGALKIGAIPVPVNTLLVAEDYRYLLRDSAPRAIVVAASLLDHVGPALAAIGDERCVLVAGHSPHRYTGLDTVLRTAANRLEDASVASAETAFWLYSSGSTGGPKGVRHRPQSLRHTAELYGTNILGINESDVIFSASKMFFAYGLGNSCSFTLHAGAQAILMAERPTPEAVIAALHEHRVTAFFGFPTLYAALLAYLEDKAVVPLSALRLCVSAGEALPAAVAERWSARFGIEILDGIGSTEALHIFLSNRPDDVRRGTSGKPVAGYEVALRDEQGSDVATVDQIGDLWCRGASLATGYWNNDEATQGAFVEGWLRTGDKYSRDADSYYCYAGRADDMLKVGGAWVSPHEVESALIAHPAVLEAAVVPHADVNGLIKPKAFVVPKDPAAASAELADHLIRFVKARIAPYKHPHWIEFRAELPKTATGKIRRALLRDEGGN